MHSLIIQNVRDQNYRFQTIRANLVVQLVLTSWEPVLRRDFLLTCRGLNGIEHHLEAMYPHITIGTIADSP
jgi:hypothetical protein